jgi:SPP1 gp7 family putative phage head morphogenesis protein
MPFDSVFHPWGAAKFENDRPLIPTDRIIKSLDKIETAGAKVTDATEQLTDRLLKQASGKSIADLDKLRFPIGPIIQEQMVGVWRSAWALGAAHAREEITIGIPEAIRQQAAGATFELDNQTLSLIAAFLTGEPGLVIPIGVEQAILARVLTIAGNYSKSVLDRLKGHLIAATVPGADGQILSRKELEKRIQATLGVAQARAETIARNETTAAYNNARVRVMQESSIVTHVRFLAIDDARTTQICRSRNGMLVQIGDTGTIAANQMPLHHRCRSLWSPVMGTINSSHADWVADPDRAWDNRDLAPLPKGWKV